MKKSRPNANCRLCSTNWTRPKLVYHDPNRRAQMAEAIRDAQYHWVIIGILAYIVVEIAAAFRWHVLLKVQGIHLSFLRLWGLFLIGMFYNQFLPGGTGGDII